MTPLGRCTVQKHGNAYYGNLPKASAQGLGLAPGDELVIGHHAETGAFLLIPAEMFTGW